MSRSAIVGTTTVLAALAVSACGRNDRPPLIEEYTGTFGTSRNAVMSNISTDAAYRSAYILVGSGVERRPGFERHPGQFCPEPPPDVAQSVSAAISAALQAEITPPAGEAGGKLGVQGAKAVATAVEPLVRRSQGLQFHRDEAFYNCVAYLNGAIGEEEYARNLLANARLAAAIITLEVMRDPELAKAPEGKVEADLTKILATLDAVEKKVNDLKPR